AQQPLASCAVRATLGGVKRGKDARRIARISPPPQGPLQRPQAHREIQPQDKHDQMERAKRRLPKARCIPPRRTRRWPSYGLAIAWPIVVCVSIHAQAAALVWNGPASECSARPRDTPTKKYGTSWAPTPCSYRTNVMNIPFLIASSPSARAAFAPFARRPSRDSRTVTPEKSLALRLCRSQCSPCPQVPYLPRAYRHIL